MTNIDSILKSRDNNLQTKVHIVKATVFPVVMYRCEYSGFISFRIDWFDLLAVQETQESSPTPQFKSINSSVISLLYGPTLTSIHDYWKNHSFD